MTGTYIDFIPVRIFEQRKTRTWHVLAKQSGGPLGEIKWFGRWRKYSFFPSPDCVFEEVCLREIAAFIEAETKAHRSRSGTFSAQSGGKAENVPDREYPGLSPAQRLADSSRTQAPFTPRS